MTPALTAKNIREVAEWIQRWRGPGDLVEITPGPMIVVQQPGGVVVYGADSIRRLAL